ncbi:MAG: hypothetical protein ACI8S6_003319, partial [Myxococcota bacterium]
MRFEKSTVISVLMVMLVGCMPAATVRTADVLAPGGLGGGMTAAVGGWSFGTSTLEEDGEAVQVTGNGVRSLGSLSEKGEMSLTAGLVPQVALWSSAPRGLSCSGCREGVTARDYTERWQLTLEVSVSGMSTRGMTLLGESAGPVLQGVDRARFLLDKNCPDLPKERCIGDVRAESPPLSPGPIDRAGSDVPPMGG